MQDEGITLDRHAVESLLGWWRDAGVDVAIDEEPRRWLVGAETATASARPAATRVVAAEKAALPDTLDALRAWIASDIEQLGDWPVRQRIAAQGDPASALMVLTDVPEREDAAIGILLSGEAGALFDRMLAALGFDRASIYLATVAPARPAGGLLNDTGADALADVTRRHVALVAPRRLWLVGRAASRVIAGMDEQKASGRLLSINCEGVTMEAIATMHPRVLLREPQQKARVWADMRRLIGIGN